MRALALSAAVTAAALVPYAPLGVDVAIVAVLVAATAAMSVRRSFDGLFFGLLALGLACMPAWLDAGWVLAVDLTAAWLLASIAVAGPRLVAVSAPIRAATGIPALVPSTPAGSVSAIRGVVFGSMLALPFGALFWSADAAFAELGRSAPLPSLSSLPARAAVFALVLLGALGLALAARRVFSNPELPSATKLSLGEWAIPLVLLNVLFLAFVVVQVAVLFGGHDHVLETAGLTYAEYARQGFWQLIAAATLTLAVIATALRVAEVRRNSHRLLRALLGSLCVLTIVIVASALHRLSLYEDAFGLTRSRLAAETFSWGLGGLFVLVLAADAVRLVRAQLVRITVGATALGLLAFSLSNPDGRIAQRNIDRWRATGDLDIAYLQGLSADAVPSLVELPEPLRADVLAPLRSRLVRAEPSTSANYSRHRARQLLTSSSRRS